MLVHRSIDNRIHQSNRILDLQHIQRPTKHKSEIEHI